MNFGWFSVPRRKKLILTHLTITGLDDLSKVELYLKERGIEYKKCNHDRCPHDTKLCEDCTDVTCIEIISDKETTMKIHDEL